MDETMIKDLKKYNSLASELSDEVIINLLTILFDSVDTFRNFFDCLDNYTTQLSKIIKRESKAKLDFIKRIFLKTV
jgi:hypothetical protein